MTVEDATTEVMARARYLVEVRRLGLRDRIEPALDALTEAFEELDDARRQDRRKSELLP